MGSTALESPLRCQIKRYVCEINAESSENYFSGFLVIWLTFLPFALWSICGWASPFVEAAVAFLLMGVENIGAFCRLLSLARSFGIISIERTKFVAL